MYSFAKLSKGERVKRSLVGASSVAALPAALLDNLFERLRLFQAIVFAKKSAKVAQCVRRSISAMSPRKRTLTISEPEFQDLVLTDFAAKAK